MTELERAERKATTLLCTFALVVAIIVGAMLVSGWGGGGLDNRIEWLYWAGAIIGAAGIAVIAVGLLPGRSASAIERTTATGMVMFLAAPVIITIAVMTDYWI